MRMVIVGLAVSLDGYIEGPNGEYDWCFTDQDYGITNLFKRVDSIFIGRKSYEHMLAMGPVGMELPKFKEYVFSNTLSEVREGSYLVSGDIKSEVERIKRKPGKDIWLFGGGVLTSSLLNMRLVDRLELAVHPILLGGGRPLFNLIEDKILLSLVETKSYSSGLVSLTYRIGGE